MNQNPISHETLSSISVCHFSLETLTEFALKMTKLYSSQHTYLAVVKRMPFSPPKVEMATATGKNHLADPGRTL